MKSYCLKVKIKVLWIKYGGEIEHGICKKYSDQSSLLVWQLKKIDISVA